MTVDTVAKWFVATPERTDSPDGILLRTLVFIRWIAITGQGATILAVHYGLGHSLPVLPALATVATSIALNLAVSIGKAPGTRLTARAASLHLAYDILQLTVLLVLTGGLENPFAIMILAPVIVSTTVLPRSSTIMLGALAGGCITLMAFVKLPVPLDEPFQPPVLYIAGIWEALILAILFISIYVGRVSEESRRLSNALSATQMALAREQRLSALGALAAAAAHQLGSPLSTIAVTAREMARQLPNDSPLAPDVDLLLSQSDRCREILAELARKPEAASGGPFGSLPLSGLIEAAADPHRDQAIALVIDCAAEHDDRDPDDDSEPSPEPSVELSPEVLHGLGNLMQNAIQHARQRAVVTVRWSAERISVAITDDGPGFSGAIRDRLGDPYVSHDGSRREGEGEHMGLGVFIALTLLSRTGAELNFANQVGGGAEVTVVWNRKHLEIEG